MKRLSLLSLLPLFAGSLFAQSNTVVGLDGRLEILDNITYWGRRGAAYPGGEVGLSMRNTMCNPGSVNLPWYAQMAENHPKFGFIITRLSGDRMEQISDRSYCKHAFTSASTSGACGPCMPNIGGTQMGVGCSDTYSAGNNGSRGNLGPADEINPWLGTWNHIGSYFDQGDPNVGAPGNNDGNQSPINVGSDDVKNRVTVQEADLQVPGASYYYGIQLIHEGESVQNRGDNIKSRGMQASWNGSNWSVSNTGVGEAFGSILQHWPGATVNSGGNGNDDGRFFVAAKATSIGGGQYHYEYAVHNVDNSRGGATLRVPVDPAAVVTNYTFGDIDNNALNDWLGTHVGNEVVFTAQAGNALNWNTIYNFGFDCNIAPGAGAVFLDEARIGAGALQVTVVSEVPGGVPVASVTSVGAGCGGVVCTDNSFYESFASAANFDLANSGISMVLSGSTYQVGNGTGTYIAPTGSSTNLNLGDDVSVPITLPFALPILGGSTNSLSVCSNGFISPAFNNSSYQPSVSSMLSGGYCWYGAWMDLNPAANGSGGVMVDSSPTMVRVTWNGVYRYNTSSPVTFQFQFFPNGNVNLIWQAMNAQNNTLVGWTIGGGANDPGNRDISVTRAAGWNVCGGGSPSLALSSLTRPVLGTTVNFDTTNIPAGTPFGAVLLSLQQAVPPTDLTSQGMPGCFGYVIGGVAHLFVAPGASSSQPFSIPNVTALSGLPIIGQSFTYSPGFTPIGVISSNGLVMFLGQV
jgi:hypothetical protein